MLQPGDPEKGLSIPRESDFEGQQDLIIELLQGLGNKDSWKAQSKPCVQQNPGERNSNLTRDWARLVCVFLGVSGGGLGLQCPAMGSGALIQRFWKAWHAGISPFEGDQHYYYYPSHRGTQPHPSTENWIKDLLSMAMPTRKRPSFPHSQFLPPGSFHKPFILIQQRADRMKTIVTQN